LRAETGEVVCWGQASASPPRDVQFSQIALGYQLACGIRRESGAIMCWSGNTPAGVPSDGRFSRLSVNDGDDFSYPEPLLCAIRADNGHVECWGTDTNGQVSGVPRDVAFREVSAGDGVSCGIRREDSAMICWGNVAAQLDVPTGEFCSLAGDSFGLGICGVTCAGRAVCLGAGLSTPPPAETQYRQISVGLFLGCGIRAADGGIDCWNNSVQVPSGVAYDQLTVGGTWSTANSRFLNEQGYPEHVCALRADDHRVECWGDDLVGQAGGVPSFTRYRNLIASEWMTSGRGGTESTFCAIRERDNLAQCWGAPSGLDRDVAYSSIASSCGLRAADAGTDCTGTFTEPLAELDPFTGSCGLRLADDTGVCWSGDGTPVDVVPGVALRGLTSGKCAIRKADDQAVCWSGGSAVAQVPAGVRFRSVQSLHYAGLYPPETVCGIRLEDDLVQCWGDAHPGLQQLPGDVRMHQLSSDLRCGILADTREIACLVNGSLQVEPSQRGVRYREVASTNLAVCGIREADGLWTCWGAVQWNPL
jgi:hypothetical protein